MTLAQDIDAIIDKVIAAEGSAYTNHPNDRGGPTKYGITLATLRTIKPFATAEDVKRITEDEARRIYYDKYVVKPGFSQVAALSRVVGVELIDAGVNVGTARAGAWLQIALNAFNRSYQSPDWPELKVDGAIGPRTISAMQTFMSLRGSERASRVLKRAIDSQQGVHYLNLGMKSPSQEQFMLGWFDHRVG